MKTKSRQFQVFADACRQNTGASFLDSGSAYGRHHERPPIAKEDRAVSLDIYQGAEGRFDIGATLETAHYLDEAVSHDADLQAQFDTWASDKDGGWFELGPRFCTEVLNLHQHARDNVYNGENDLSQVFVWESYSPQEEESDWLYADDSLVLIYVHTGCDVRGGYGRPLFCHSDGSYSVPTDFVAQFYAESGVSAEGVELTREELQSLDERWQCGYASHPAGAVREDVAEIVEWTDGSDLVTCKLKSGETVKIGAAMPYFG